MNGDVIRFESLIRLADPASPGSLSRYASLPAASGTRWRRSCLIRRLRSAGILGAGLVEKVVAWQAAHRVRADLADRARLMGVQCQLVHGLEDLGDPAGAYQVAETALAEYLASQPGDQQTPEHDDLSAAVLRLARTRNTVRTDPLIDATVALPLRAGQRWGWKPASGPPLTC